MFKALKNVAIFLLLSAIILLIYFCIRHDINSLWGKSGVGKISIPCANCKTNNRFDAEYCKKCSKLTYLPEACKNCGSRSHSFIDKYCIKCTKELPEIKFYLALKRYFIVKAIKREKENKENKEHIKKYSDFLIKTIKNQPNTKTSGIKPALSVPDKHAIRVQAKTIEYQNGYAQVILNVTNDNYSNANAIIKIDLVNFFLDIKRSETAKIYLNKRSTQPLTLRIYIPLVNDKQKRNIGIYSDSFSVENIEVVSCTPA